MRSVENLKNLLRLTDAPYMPHFTLATKQTTGVQIYRVYGYINAIHSLYINVKFNEYEGNLKFYIWGCFPLEAQRSKSLCDMNDIILHDSTYIPTIYSTHNIVGANEMEFSFSLK